MTTNFDVITKRVYNRQIRVSNGWIMLTPEILLTLKLHQELFIDPRRIDLLKAINNVGSLSQAAKQIGISYKTAWDSINQINLLAPHPFVITAIGGKGGGGTTLSAYAVRFIQLYDLLTQLQIKAFTILNDDNVPLDDILAATAKLSLQTSARNQLYSTVTKINTDSVGGFITVRLSDNVTELTIFITKSSVERLQLSENKTVIVFIKAPLIELSNKRNSSENQGVDGCDNQQLTNRLLVTTEKITQDNQWSEITFSLPTGITIQATKLSSQVSSLGLKERDQIDLLINPEHIVIATLV